jgi:hypothetical protein
MSSLFRDLQTAVRDRLKTSLADHGGPLALNPVLEIEGDLDAQIARRLADTGLGLQVLTPKIMPGPAHDQLTVTVVLDLIENPVLNQDPSGSRIPALEVLESILAVLLDWEPSEAWTSLQFTGCELLQTTPTIVREATWETTTLLTLNETT